VLNGIIVHKRCRRLSRGEITTAGRRFTISGGTNPLKSQMTIVPCSGCIWRDINLPNFFIKGVAVPALVMFFVQIHGVPVDNASPKSPDLLGNSDDFQHVSQNHLEHPCCYHSACPALRVPPEAL